MTKILVTGGSGYFGTLLLDLLLKEGFSCRNFDINPSDQIHDRLEHVVGDIRDLDAVQEACGEIDIVYHNVAQVPLAKDRELFLQVNIEGTKNLIEAARGRGVGKIVSTSSSAVFGIPRTNPVTEQTAPTPMEAYGRAKYEAELLCLDAVDDGLDVAIIRPRTILGHGRLGIFQILFEWIRQGRNVPVLGRGDNLYQFVHADDLARACMLAGNRKGSGVYNCGAASFASMRETLEDLCEFASTGSRVRSVPRKPAEWAMRLTSALGVSPLGAYHALMYGRSLYFDISKSQNELGWQPEYSSFQMMRESYLWYCENRESVLSRSEGSHHTRAVKQGVLAIVSRIL